MAIAGVTDDSAEMRSRICIAKSVLGHAPLYRSVRKALAALDGATLAELAADQDAPERCPEEGSREYLSGWHDGHDAGYAAALERLGMNDPAGVGA
jgi:hypothetical protein